MLLDKINKAGDIRKINSSQYEKLANEIRQFLIQKVSKTGGHLASNLGAVELTMALHLVFNPLEDKIIWDVGHQSYTHKILTGRRQEFDGLRQYGGMSGFPKRKESNCDAFNTGHSSTSISAGLGLVKARDLLHQNHAVISVIGDGALTGGMAYEAMNNAAKLKTNFIIILNDNKMSISENIGGISMHLNKLRTASAYNDLKEYVTQQLSKVPGVGENLINNISKTKSSIKQLLVPGMLFENMGLTYLGPVDGHDIEQLIRVLKQAHSINRPVVVHILTTKGKGYAPAEKNPSAFHGVSPFCIATGKTLSAKKIPTWTDVFSKALCELASEDDKITAITAAMPEGTGLNCFQDTYPERFFDVGIAEEHAVTFSAGMAAGGLKPVVAVYSSFLQRAYDQILHDVCIQNLPVVFALDRAGLVGNDGETHQGIFDLSYLSNIPNMTICAPKNSYELFDLLSFALSFNRPIAIRYPRGTAYTGLKQFRSPIIYGKNEILFEEQQIALLATGSMVQTAETVRDRLKDVGYCVSLINVRFIQPMDTQCLQDLSESHELLVTMEENVCRGSYGEHVAAWVKTHNLQVQILNIAIPDMYVEHGNVDILKEEMGLDAESIVSQIVESFEK